MPWGSQEGEHAFGWRWSKEAGWLQSTQVKRNCTRLSGKASIGSDSTLPNRPPYANNHSTGPPAIMPSVKLHRRFFNEVTKEILQECVLICSKIPASLVDTLITKEVWGNHWGKAREETSSLVSGWHFSHYKAGLCAAYMSHLSFRTRLTRWELSRHVLSLLVFTLMTSSISWKILWRISSAVFFQSDARLISWALSDDFWEFTFHGISHPHIWTNLVLPPTWSKVSSTMRATLFRQPHHIVLMC